MKKIACVIVGILFIGLLVLVGIKIYRNKSGADDPNAKWRDSGWYSGEYEAYFVREKIPTDIIWYGEWTGYEYEIPVRFESEVSDEILKIRDGYQKVYIVINDMGGTVGLTDKDYELMSRYVNNDARYNFIYLGNDKLEYLAELEGYNPEHINEEELSIGFYRLDNAIVAIYGTYTITEVQHECNVCELVLGSFEGCFSEE